MPSDQLYSRNARKLILGRNAETDHWPSPGSSAPDAALVAGFVASSVESARPIEALKLEILIAGCALLKRLNFYAILA